MPKRTFTSDFARQRIEAILAALAERQMSRAELMTKFSMKKSTAVGYIGHLSRNPRRIFVKTWDVVDAGFVPVYAIGDDPDCPMPEAKSSTARAKATRERIYADPERYRSYLARRRERNLMRRVKATADLIPSWMRALAPAPALLRELKRKCRTPVSSAEDCT